jgi:hypothetical protein
MALTDAKARNAKAGLKPIKLFDGGGLYLLIQPNGTKWWRFKYYFEGKEKLLSMGNYQDVGLREAREARDEARKLLRTGVDPSENRKAIKGSRLGDTNTFEVLAREWLAKFSPDWAHSHRTRETAILERDVLPWLGRRPIRDIAALEILKVVKNVEAPWRPPIGRCGLLGVCFAMPWPPLARSAILPWIYAGPTSDFKHLARPMRWAFVFFSRYVGHWRRTFPSSMPGKDGPRPRLRIITAGY